MQSLTAARRAAVVQAAPATAVRRTAPPRTTCSVRRASSGSDNARLAAVGQAAPVAPVAVRRARSCTRVRASSSATNTAETKQAMLMTVHRWFDSLSSADHAIEDLVHRDCHLIDNSNQACYAGYKAIKHRMQAVHEVLPKLVEAADVTDAAHATVAAHWVAKPAPGEKGEAAAGTYLFKFDSKTGLILEITSYPDAPEDEFLEA